MVVVNRIIKSLIALIICWLFAFCVSFYTASETLDMVERVCYSLAFAGILLIAYSLNTPRKSLKNNNRTSNVKILYVFEGEFGKKLVYRIQGSKVYEGLSNKYKYEIKGDKIYRAFSSKWDFQIKGNRIYKGYDKKVAYRIAGNKVYAGEFEKRVAYRLTNRRNG